LPIRKIVVFSLVMDDVLTSEFPFVQQLPKREKTKLQRFWESFQEMKDAQIEHGVLLPVKFCAALADVSHQRIHQLIAAGTIKTVVIQGHPFVTEASFVEWMKTDRKPGRHLSLGEMCKQSFSAARRTIKNS